MNPIYNVTAEEIEMYMKSVLELTEKNTSTLYHTISSVFP